jgi:ATP-binding cassette subfamily B multidrug efflux pump
MSGIGWKDAGHHRRDSTIEARHRLGTDHGPSTQGNTSFGSPRPKSPTPELVDDWRPVSSWIPRETPSCGAAGDDEIFLTVVTALGIHGFLAKQLLCGDESWRTLRVLIRLLHIYLRPYLRSLSTLVVLQLVQTAATLLLPTLNAEIIDKGITKGDSDHILFVGMVMLVIAVVQISASVGAAYIGSRVAMALGRDVRSSVFRRVQDFSALEVRHFGTPSLITRTVGDVQRVQTIALAAFNVAILTPIMCIGAITLALKQDIPLSGLLIALIPVIAIATRLIMTPLHSMYVRLQICVDRINLVLREQITGVQVVRAFVRDTQERDRFKSANTELFGVSLGVGRLMAAIYPVVLVVINMFSIALVWFGARRIDAGAMQIGALTAFLSYVALMCISIILAMVMTLQKPKAEASSRRILEVLDTTTSVLPPMLATHPGSTTGHLDVRGAEFRHPGAEEPVLRGIDLIARPGETVAVVGSIGSGKSTLLNLILRQFDATAGSVLINGVDVRELDPKALHQSVASVPQQPYLFTGTVATNLRYGNLNATDEDLWHALEVAQARDFVERMPDRLNAKISQGGRNVSGGQRQRIAIARALVRQPEIYLFDDCFSALDNSTNAELRVALAHETSSATVVLVAERISTIQRADRIVVLDAGRVVGTGTHDGHLRHIPGHRALSAKCAGGRLMTTASTTSPATTIEQTEGAEPDLTENAAERAPEKAAGKAAEKAAEKALDPRGSGRRMLKLLLPHRLRVAMVLVLGTAGVALGSLGPINLGRATDLIFAGALSHDLSPGSTKAEVVARLRAEGRDTLADVFTTVDLVPGHGIDFDQVGRVLLLVVALYLAGSFFILAQERLAVTIVQDVAIDLRANVQDKLTRLPLSHFDHQPTGDLLSRVTNDVDNVQQTMHQALSQLFTSILSVVTVLALMFLISPPLALIVVVSLPIAGGVAVLILSRSQPRFREQWAATGTLSTHVEEMYTGHSLVEGFDQREEAERAFDEHNEALFASSTKAQFLAASVESVMMFVANVNYVVVALVGALLVTTGSLSIGHHSSSTPGSSAFR